MARKSRKNILVHKEFEIKTGIYARLSVFNESDSIENQIEIIKMYLKGKEDFKIVKIYKDKGVSGGTFYREAMAQLKEDMENGVINCVIVKDLSRLGRNFIETSYYIEKIFPMYNVRFIAVNDCYDSEYADKSDISVPFRNMINEFYLSDISIKITSALNAKRKSSHIGAVPYGYDRDKSGKLIPNEKAEIVRKIFNMRKQGKGYTYIADRLNEWGEKPPSALRYKKEFYKKGQWSGKTIKNILENEVYMGILVQYKTSAGYRIDECGNRKKVRVRNNKELNNVIENSHTAIIEKVDLY